MDSSQDHIERRFVAAWLYTAVGVSLLRFLLAANPTYDLGLQIQAGHNLLVGHGLSLYEHRGSNLGDPAIPATLTHFPAGYSLLVAAFMGVGLGVGTIVKVLGATATILGWWGWARL